MKCKNCGVTDEAMFYASIGTYCKEHWKQYIKACRAAKPEHYKAYDKARLGSAERVEARRAYRKTPAGKAAVKRATQGWRQRNAAKVAAHNAISKAIMRGHIERQPCSKCGESMAEAHHPDYSKPMDVIWLCDKHHKEAHANL